jgi:predicted TIM-barrel fold metal-dependent hydrolase
MIIDAHTHIGKNEHITANVDELLKSMDKAGIDKALVFAGMLNGISNEDMLEQIAPHKDRLFGVAAYDHAWAINSPNIPWGHPLQLADWYNTGKIVAVKFYTGYEYYYPYEADSVLRRLEDVKCPAIFHSGDCLNSVKCAKLKYAHPLHIDDVAVDFPKMNFIIAHMAFPFVREAAEVCYKNANVYSDISGFVYGKFGASDKINFRNAIIEFLNIAGSDKLLLGTDWPISDQSSYLSALDCGFGETLKAQDLTENIIKAFNLKV